MPLVEEIVHPRGLNFENQRKVVLLRDKKVNGKMLAFKEIAKLVLNLKNKKSTEDVVRRVYERFSRSKGRVSYRFAKCGRKPWKLTKEIGSHIVSRLLSRRKEGVVTSVILQADVYKDKEVSLSLSAIRKHLLTKGYKWLPRSQKRRYSKEDRAKRMAFAIRFANMSQKALSKYITFAMDGVILTYPQDDHTERMNYCLAGETHMWRKRSEAAMPQLAGDDPYADQVPAARALPLWGAISARGFREIIIHKNKKLNKVEWLDDALCGGKLLAAVRELKATGSEAPSRLLCDNEGFLEAKVSKAYYKKKKISLLHNSARSPDLNPIESFWGWLRRQLRLRELEAIRLGRRALGKNAYKAMLRRFLRTKKAQDVAKAKWSAFKKVCKIVVKKKGAASGK